MIEALVSDLGQVVLPFDFAPAKAFLRERCACAADGDPWHRLVALHERAGLGVGRCTGPEFYRMMVDDMGLRATYDELARAWSNVFWEDPATIDLIRRARVRHRILLSNTNAIHWGWIVERHPHVLAEFDHLLVSQEVGLEKPDPRIYRHVESLTGLPAAAHLFIDDLAENVEGARACGWDGIVHTSAPELERALRMRGLLEGPEGAGRG